MSCIPLIPAGPRISRQPSRLNLYRVHEISWAILNHSMSSVLNVEGIDLHQGKWHLLLVLRVWEELDSAVAIVQKRRSRGWEVYSRPIDAQSTLTGVGNT